MKGLSRRALHAVDVEVDLPLVVDKREEDIKVLTRVDEGVYETLHEVFAGTGLMADQRKVKLLLKLRTDVAVAWNQTRDAFIEIGRALNDVDRELDLVERDRFRVGFRQLFPFSETVASQFRAIARAVDNGHLPREAVPGSYGAAYQMALLTPGQRDIARARGLIQPNVSRDTLIEFRREVTAVQSHSRGLDPARMRAELGRLERTKKKALLDLVALRRRMHEIRALLGSKAEE